jgi:hypothetical protein
MPAKEKLNRYKSYNVKTERPEFYCNFGRASWAALTTVRTHGLLVRFNHRRHGKRGSQH